jgi:hypothetical protein
MLRANLRLVFRAADHIIFVARGRNKARPSELNRVRSLPHQQSTRADHPKRGRRVVR